jgi:hypothetical protein
MLPRTWDESECLKEGRIYPQMPSESRLIARDNLFVELGFVVDPIRRLVTDPKWKERLPFVDSQFAKEVNLLAEHVQFFAVTGDFDRSIAAQRAHNAVHGLHQIAQQINSHMGIGGAEDTLKELVERVKTALRNLPCDDASLIMPGLSPLATYHRLLAHCRAAQKRVELFDAYMDKAVYLRYFDDIDPGVQIVVVTSQSTMADVPRRDRIVAVSELLALERPANYRLLVTTTQHDRHLRIDDEILHVGGSLKDAAKSAPYTISSLDPVQSNHQFLDDIIANATEWFGPTITTHRKT